MSVTRNVPISLIDENPHRNLGTYPTIQKKVEALQRSIEHVGLWEGIIARQAGDRYQMAFGHHRLEAARGLGLTEIPLIVRDLSDEEMLQFMGRENGEDYRTEFLIMLNTWEGAVNFRNPDRSGSKCKAIDAARLLGWVATHGKSGSLQMNDTARACAAAYAVLQGGYMDREDLDGINVKAAQSIVERAHSRMEQIEKAAKVTKTPPKQVESAKKHVAKGAKVTADDVREGNIAQKDIRAEVDVNAYRSAATSKVKDTPLFAVFGKALVDRVKKMLASDASAEQLEEIAKSVNAVTMEADHAVLRQLGFEMSELGKRSEAWRKRLIPTSEKVVGLRALEDRTNG